MNTISYFSSPQLRKVHTGKVRESFQISEDKRLIVVTDRLSCFDKILNTLLPNKGAILNSISNAWFAKTRHIIDNHFIEVVDPNITLVQTAEPIRIEMIVRKYLTGSIWRKYCKGVRSICGITLPDGMERNDPFPSAIVTPTTKDITDVDISPKEIVDRGLVPQEVYQEMERKSLELFNYGSELCATKNLILVDSKYEFGWIEGSLILIDELHTPDSSRFWPLDAYKEDKNSEHWMDKEYIRQWLLKNMEDEEVKDDLDEAAILEAEKRYQTIYRLLLDEDFIMTSQRLETRIHQNLIDASLIKEGYIAIIMGSKSDLDHALKIKKVIDSYNIMCDIRVVSAHKNGEEIALLVEEYNHALEPGAIIAIAGRSNGLGGALAANLTLPVINCPPFKDYADMIVNMNSSLIMPSAAPAATCIDPKNAALMALRSLNLFSLKQRFLEDIQQMKKQLLNDDKCIREEYCVDAQAVTDEVSV